MKQIKEIKEPRQSPAKQVMKTNIHMSQQEAIMLAINMEKCYDEANIEQDELGKIEHQNDWNRLHQVENDCWAFETLSGDDILDYFGVLNV